MSGLESNLPEIHTEHLSVADLQATLAEIEHLGSQVSIQVKGGGTRMAEVQAMQLQDVAQALQHNQSVQVRYVRDGVLWSDTYTATEQGIRRIHFALPVGPP